MLMRVQKWGGSEKDLPLLDFVKGLKERDGNEDDDGFLVVLDIDLLI